MLNLHCYKNGEKKNIHVKKKNKKTMQLSRFEPRKYGLKIHEVSTTLWRPMELIDKNN